MRINESGSVAVWKDASEAGTNFDGLTRAEGWARSSLDFSRYKADGTKYATYQSQWIVTSVNGEWGVQARSSVAP